MLTYDFSTSIAASNLVCRDVTAFMSRVADSSSSCMTGSHLVKLFVAFVFRLLCPAVVSCPKLPNSFTEAEKKNL